MSRRTNKPSRGNDYSHPAEDQDRGLRLSYGELAGVAMAVLAAPLGLPPQLARRLSEAERDVAAALVGGKTYASIAQRRGSSNRTVANQVRSIFRKLEVGSRAELIRTVMSYGR